MDQNIEMEDFNTLKACFVKHLPILFNKADKARNKKRTHTYTEVRPSKKKKLTCVM